MIIHVRPAEPRDAEDIARIRVRTWQAAYAKIIPAPILDALDVTAETHIWRERLETLTANHLYIIAELAEEPLAKVAGEATSPGPNIPPARIPAGYCMCGPAFEPDPNYPGEIYALYVLPEYQHLGAGGKLMEHALGWLQAEGFAPVIVYVLRDNHPARRFYESMGGKAARERVEDVRGVMLVEVGYGYGR